jgi:hypothetical protein
MIKIDTHLTKVQRKRKLVKLIKNESPDKWLGYAHRCHRTRNEKRNTQDELGKQLILNKIKKREEKKLKKRLKKLTIK